MKQKLIDAGYSLLFAVTVWAGIMAIAAVLCPEGFKILFL